MRRGTVIGKGAAALAAAWMVVGAGGAGAGEPQSEKAKDKAQAHTRTKVIHVGGGARLGVQLDDVGKDDLTRLKLADEKGAEVKEVVPDSPAAKAGLEPGDVILEFQGQPVWSAAQLARYVRETPGGRTVTLEISRDGAARSVQATLGERRIGGGPAFDRLADLGFELPEVPEPPDVPEAPRALIKPPRAPGVWGFNFDDGTGEAHAHLFRDLLAERPAKLGIQYEELSDQLAGYFKVEGGVLVSTVEEGGPAAKAGLKAGDVIVKVDGKTVKDGGELRLAVSRLDAGQEATLTVQRDGRPLDLKLAVGGRARRAPRGRTT